jgi:CAAX protease family protein
MAQLFLNQNERRLRSGWRLGIQFVLLITIFLSVLLPFTIVTAVLPFFSPGLFGAFEANFDAVTLFIVFGAEAIAVTLSVFLARRFVDRCSLASLGLWWNSRARRDLLTGFLFAGVMIALVFLIEMSAGWLVVDDFAWSSFSAGRILFQLLLLFIGFVLVGWTEELLFRGYWLQNLGDGLNWTLGILISSALFALAHIGNEGFSPAAIVGLFLAGVFFAFSLFRSGSLWLPIGLHIGWNFFEGPVFGFQVSGLEAFRLTQQTGKGPDIMIGAAFGPEAGLVLLPALGLGVLLVYLYTRRRERFMISKPAQPASSPGAALPEAGTIRDAR